MKTEVKETVRCIQCGRQVEMGESVRSEVMVGKVNCPPESTGTYVYYCRECSESWRREVCKEC